jgi:hypothetical protein
VLGRSAVSIVQFLQLIDAMDEATKNVPLAFTIVDVMAGATPDSPRFDWRRRNMTSGGNGPFSTWESVLGKELFATPVTSQTSLSPA